MTENIYKIVFTGEIMKGHELESVKKELAGIFRWEMDKVEELFSVSPIVIAENIDYQKAIKYNEPFKKAGAVCKIYSLKNEAEHVFDHQPSPSSPLQKSVIKEYSVNMQSKETLKQQKKMLDAFFSDSYERAKVIGGIGKNKWMSYWVIGLFFLLSFVLAAIQGHYMIGVAIGLFNAVVVSILIFIIHKKAHKNNAINIALYFKEHISIDRQENYPLFLAALFLWTENIPVRDHTKKEILSLCDELSRLNTADQDAFRRYLKDLRNLDTQGTGKTEKNVPLPKTRKSRKGKNKGHINPDIRIKSFKGPKDKSYISEGAELN